MLSFTAKKAPVYHSNRVALYAAAVCFLTYASVYAFRKPFSVGIYANQPAVFGLAFKDALVISQLLGYVASKFYGIKFIAELQRLGRGKMILLLVSVSWLALLLFALVPAPYNVIFLFINGFPLGIIWGIVFSFVEGRKTTDFIGASLAVSFIFSSGFVKSVAKWLMLDLNINELWVPFVTGLVFIIPLILFVYLLKQVPMPSPQDRALRVERIALNKEGRKQFFSQLKWGLILLITIYIFLTIFRDIRDSFAADIWSELGFGNEPSVFTATEAPVTLAVLLLIGSMILIRNNKKAFQITIGIIVAGFVVAGISSLLFVQHRLGPFAWMTLTGLGLYMGYIPFNCILFERMIAVYKKPGNVGFLMYLADSFGYLGSITVLLFKTIFHIKMQWAALYSHGVVLLSILGVILSLVAMQYFHKKMKTETA